MNCLPKLRASLLLLIVCLSCVAAKAANFSNSRTTTQTNAISFGKVIERIACAKVPGQSYAVYVPSNYVGSRAWPVLYAFDPGARGSLPVNRFQEAAEQYGWIVVGSNNSQNGSMQQSLDAWVAMWDDTHQRFNIDARRVYATGFSGGARVAIYFARLCRDCIAGVIACGAGFPQGVTPSSDLRFNLFGLAGVDDFNFPELRNLDDALTKAGVVHVIEFFDGRHDWPPSAQATHAVEWMEVQAIKSNRRKGDETLLGAIWQKQLAEANSLEQAGKLVDAYRSYLKISESFASTHDEKELNDVNGQVKRLIATREVKEALHDERRQLEKQQQQTQEINDLIMQRSNEADPALANRLHSLLASLRTSSNAIADTGERRVARRVLEGMRIGLFELGIDQLQRQKRFADAARTFEAATEVSPERPGAFYYLASAYALKGEKKRALQTLQTAVEKGFTDSEAIVSNTAFDSVRNEPAYLELIAKLKSH